MRHPRLIVTLFTLLAALLAYSAGQQQGRDSVTFTIPPSADADVPPLPIPPVTEIAPTGDVADVVAYYTAHEDEVIALFGDADRDQQQIQHSRQYIKLIHISLKWV